MKMKGEACLQADDFVALRSLARYGRWEQGRRLMWRFARHEGWESVQYDQCPALDAAERLERAGLVEEAVCHCGCKRDIIQLTERGKTFVANDDLVMYEAEVFKQLGKLKPKMALATILADETDYEAAIVNSSDDDEKFLFSRLDSIRGLAKNTENTLSKVFNALVAGV